MAQGGVRLPADNDVRHVGRLDNLGRSAGYSRPDNVLELKDDISLHFLTNLTVISGFMLRIDRVRLSVFHCILSSLGRSPFWWHICKYFSLPVKHNYSTTDKDPPTKYVFNSISETINE